MKEQKSTSTFNRMLGLVKPYLPQFILALSLALSLSVLGAVRPWLIQETVDKHIADMDYDSLLLYCGLFLAALLIESLVRYNFIYTTSWIGQTIIKNFRSNVFKKMTRLRLTYFDKTPIGALTTRTINDVEAVEKTFSEGLISITADLVTVVVIMALMFYTNWQLTFVCLSVFPLLIISTYVFKERVKAVFGKVREMVSRMNSFIQEHISGIKIIQLFTAEQREHEKFKVLNKQLERQNIKTVLYYAIFFPVVEVILASATALILWFGAKEIIDGDASIGVLIAFILYVNMLFRPLRMMADKFNTLQMGLVASKRVFSILDLDEQIPNEGLIKPKTFEGNLEFKNVWFAYEANNPVLKNVSFQLEKGKTLAIVGATGSGKSTIINLLLRFYDIDKGSILIDNTKTQDFELNALRKKISLVLQDVFLFSGSVYDNITLHDKSITEETVVEASKLIGAHGFIEKLPGQYQFNVMERGATLSVGQRQLISFVRALVFDPAILILDEATSSVDSESEKLIQYAIENLIKNRTSIVIAHRLSTIQNADKILVLDQGEVKQVGTHQELIGQKGIYKTLHDEQLVGVE